MFGRHWPEALVSALEAEAEVAVAVPELAAMAPAAAMGSAAVAAVTVAAMGMEMFDLITLIGELCWAIKGSAEPDETSTAREESGSARTRCGARNRDSPGVLPRISYARKAC